MPRMIRRITIVFAIFGLLLVPLPQGLHAQMSNISPQQLDQLLAPIALYPDALLAQITTASTDPQQILDVVDFIAGNPRATPDMLMDAAQRQGFDPAFIALVNFPGVLEMMADNIDDYAALGDVVRTDQAAVAASVQRLRTMAWETGALRNTTQQTVNVTFNNNVPIYSIVPANPQVVFVPYYDPTLVFVPGARVGTVVSVVPGIGIGTLWASPSPWGWGGWGWNWGGGVIMFNRGVWGPSMWGWRSPNPWFRPRPPVWGNRPGFGGNWRHRPPNWRPPSNTRPPRPIRPGPGGRPGFRPGGPGNNRPGGPGNNRPGGPGNNRPGGPGNNRPGGPGGTRPGAGGPGNNRPGTGAGNNRPGTGAGNNRPGTGAGNNRPGTGAGNNRPGAGAGNNRPGTGAGNNRPGTGAGNNRPGTGTGNDRPGAGAGNSRPGGGSGQPAPRPPAQNPRAQRPSGQRPPNQSGEDRAPNNQDLRQDHNNSRDKGNRSRKRKRTSDI